MLTETTLCMGCMNDKTYDGPCKLCGYSDDDPYIPTYLAPKTLLNDRYIVGRLLSYNGEGATYIGYDKAAGTKITIKEFMPDTLCSRRKGETAITVNSQNSPLYKTYMSEFDDLNRTLMKLRGMTHTQAVLDVFRENNTCYAILEFINGISLKTFLANSSGEMTWDQVKELFPPIFTTLSLAHRAGIIHRGLSLQTIFVTDKMELKLTGFSISAARVTNTEIACELFSGYAAPEQYTNEMNGTWTDVYGISAVLYRVLTGTPPIESASAELVSGPEPMLVNRNVPANVSKVIMHGMAYSPEHRIRDMNELINKLFAPPKYAPAETESKKADASEREKLSPKAQKKLKKQQKERKKMVAALVTAGVTLLVFVGALIWSLNINRTTSPQTSENSSSSALGTSSQTSAPANSAVSEPTPSEDSTNNMGSSTISEFEETIIVPDFTDRRYERTLTQYEGIFTFVPEYKYSETHAAGLMYDQSVEEGESVKKGTTINVKVSKGTSEVKLPDYQGLTRDEYVAKLTALNIKYQIYDVHSETVKDNYVAYCSKEVGDVIKVDEGEVVEVFVAGV